MPLPKSTRISVDEYLRLRHKLLSLRREYTQAVYAREHQDITNTVPVLTAAQAKLLEAQIGKVERTLADSELYFPEGDEENSLSFSGTLNRVVHRLSHTIRRDRG